MILVIDSLNKHKFPKILDDMFRLRARVFGGRLGWEVEVNNGMERDMFDDLDPAYVVSLDDEGNVVACVRALQTTGPHMLSDVFSAILDGEPPLRSPQIWESTRFCVDTKRLSRGKDRNSVSYHTSELMLASLEYARDAGITDIITVIDPVMNRVLKRSNNAPYDYVGCTADMGKVPAMAALLDCTDERINRVREFSGIHHDVFISDEDAMELPKRPAKADKESFEYTALLDDYCQDQILDASTEDDLKAALALQEALSGVSAARPRMAS